MEVQSTTEIAKFMRATSKVGKDISDKFRKRSLDILKLGEYGDRKCRKLENIIQSFSQQLLSHIEEECKAIVRDFELEQKLQDLTRLKEEQVKYKGTPAWRPSGQPDDDVEDHLREPYKEFVERLATELHECEKETRQLSAQVAEGKKDLEGAEAEIDLKVEEMRKQYRAVLRAVAVEEVPTKWWPS